MFTTENGHTKKAYLSSHGLKKEVKECTSSFLIKTPEQMQSYRDGLAVVFTNLTEGWDIPFEIELEDSEDNKRILSGRSILRCASNNY